MADEDAGNKKAEDLAAANPAAKPPEDTAAAKAAATKTPGTRGGARRGENKPKADAAPDLTKSGDDDEKAAPVGTDDKVPTTDEARAKFASIVEDPPDPLDMHSEKSRDAADAAASDAMRAAYEHESTDLTHMGFQMEQFDSSGNNVLSALAFPSQNALRASKAVEDRQGITKRREKSKRARRAATKAPDDDKK